MRLPKLQAIILLCSLILISISTIKAEAYTDCREQATNQGLSDSCWMPLVIKGRNASQIEISPYTLTEMITIVDHLNPHLKPLLTSIKDKQHKLGISAKRGVGFIFDYDAGENPPRANSDCKIYIREQRGRLDKSRWILSLSPSDCNRLASSLAIAFWESKNNIAEKVSTPFEKYYLSEYPKRDTASQYQGATYNDLWFGITRHGLLTPSIQEKITKFTSVSIPVTEYTVVKGDSLKSIATRFTGNEENWEMLWAVNIDHLSDPYVLKEGTSLKIPLKIIKWEQVDAEEQDINIARNIYGDISYVDLVSNIRLKQEQAGAIKNFYVPIFHSEKKIIFASFGPETLTIQGTIITVIPDYEKGTVTLVYGKKCDQPCEYMLLSKDGTIYSLIGTAAAMSLIEMNINTGEEVMISGKTFGSNKGWILYVE